jgi:hypothetical protein
MHIFAHVRRRAVILGWIPLVLFSAFGAACRSTLPEDSRCRNLVYKEGGLPRSEYLPCAGEIVAALDELEPQTRAASRGDREARSQGRATLARVNALVQAAGGRNLMERWEDRALTTMNVNISNAVTRYEEFYMVRIVEEPDQFAAQSRQAAIAALDGAVRNHEEARRDYNRLR